MQSYRIYVTVAGNEYAPPFYWWAGKEEMMIRMVMLAIFILILQGHCFASKPDSLVAEWDSAEEIAMNSPRTALPSSIARLQDIRAKAFEYYEAHPNEKGKQFLLDYMDAVIKGYLEFLRGGERGLINIQFEMARMIRNNWRRSVEDPNFKIEGGKK
jgi:hypothetical protein